MRAFLNLSSDARADHRYQSRDWGRLNAKVKPLLTLCNRGDLVLACESVLELQLEGEAHPLACVPHVLHSESMVRGLGLMAKNKLTRFKGQTRFGGWALANTRLGV